MKLLLIRHAESVGNQAQRMQGHAAFELAPAGYLQAAQLAQFLSTHSWPPTHVYSSPLQRATQTADILLQGRQALLQYDDSLKELHPGIFQGLTWAEAQTRYPELCQALETSPTWIPIPGAESLQQAQARADRFWQQLFSQHQDADAIWIITHGGFLQYLIAALLKCDRVWGLDIPPTALFEFWLDRQRWSIQDQDRANPSLWQIRRFGDRPHLNPGVNTCVPGAETS